MPETQSVPITCPNCRTEYDAPLRTVIDVSQNPELRQAFLASRVNVAVCPQCRTGGLLEVPLVYHDAPNEFLAIYFPSQLSVPEMERQKMIGEMTQALMRSLPPEQRKGYFLNPRQFVSRQSLMDAIMGTMGVSQEELDRQRKKMRMLEQLLVMADDPKGLEMMIKGQDNSLDYEFFMILSSMLEQAEASGDAKSAERLRLLRESLMPITSWGQRAAKQQAALETLRDVSTADELVEKVAGLELETATAAAVALRPLMDYRFFELLTQRIDASEGEQKARLEKLRTHLADLTQRLDEAARAEVDAARDLLQQIIESPNPRSAVRERAEEISDIFMSLLSLNLQEAERRQDTAAKNLLGMVYAEVMDMMEERMPPEVQLINDLLRADYPDGSRGILQESRNEVTPEFLELMEQMAAELVEREGEAGAETAKRLRDIRAQALLMV
jgi:hypothetical protein